MNGFSDGFRQRNRVVDERLAALTTFRIGGPATVASLDARGDLAEALATDPRWLGKGANLLVGDALAARPVLRLGRDNIRANGISAGPIKTLAASGISGFGKLLKMASDNSPLKRNVTIEEVGNTAAFLLSDLASGITGEITYVDAGYSINALNVPEEA